MDYFAYERERQHLIDEQKRERQRLIRLVVARDWAVMVSFLEQDWRTSEAYMTDMSGWPESEVGALPCAEDFVDEMLGEKK